MSASVNKVILIGNLGRDPEIRHTQGGTEVASFSVVTSETWNDKQTGERRERTEWHNVTCFGRNAEIAREYLRQGSKIYVEGSLKTDSWEKDGVKRYKTEIVAQRFQMLDGRPGGEEGDRMRSATEWDARSGNRVQAGQRPAKTDEEEVEEGIPF